MTIECCADAIAMYGSKLVLVERLNTPKGYALPGGRLDAGESLEQCIVREMKEETGFDFSIGYQFRTYSAPDRDPRGQKVSTVYFGKASGLPKNEPNKTRIVLMGLNEIDRYKDCFAFDHYKIIKDYMEANAKMGAY